MSTSLIRDTILHPLVSTSMKMLLTILHLLLLSEHLHLHPWAQLYSSISLSHSLGISNIVTPSTTPPPLLSSDACLTPPLPVMHTLAFSSCMSLADQPNPLVTTLMTLDSTLSSPTTTTTKANDPPLDGLHLPIALWKELCGYTQPPIAHFVSFNHLSLTYCTFAFFIF